MFSKIFLLLLVGGSFFPVITPVQKLLDFGAFDLKITGTKEISHFTGENGEAVKASRRDARLVEVELTCAANSTGEFALYPAMFSALCDYRGLATVIPARAIGTKVKDRMTKKVSEYWYNRPGVSIVIGLKAGEKFRRYVILELPKEVKNYHLSGPKFIPAAE